MPSKFAQAERAVSAACDDRFGETTRLLPRSGGGRLASFPDPSRPECDIVGIVDDEPVTSNFKGSRSNDGDRAAVKSDLVIVDYSDAVLEGIDLREGDFIRLVDRAGAPDCKVASINPDNMGRVYVSLRKLAP